MAKFDKDSLGNRMKSYEEVNERKLVPNVPFIIRLDGVAFHTFTKKMLKPIDDLFVNTMQKTMLALCADVPFCKYGYVQSDEITLVCIIDDIKNSDGYYGNRINKIITVTAAKATKYFNKIFYENVCALEKNPNVFKNVVDIDIYKKKLFIAEFDSRVFNIPETEILNNLIWRQQDAVRNSINNLGFAYFTKTEMKNKNTAQVQDMLMLEKGVNWNDCSTYQKRGGCCYKKEMELKTKDGVPFKRNKWVLDLNMGILTQPDVRELTEKIIFG